MMQGALFSILLRSPQGNRQRITQIQRSVTCRAGGHQVPFVRIDAEKTECGIVFVGANLLSQFLSERLDDVRSGLADTNEQCRDCAGLRKVDVQRSELLHFAGGGVLFHRAVAEHRCIGLRPAHRGPTPGAGLIRFSFAQRIDHFRATVESQPRIFGQCT